MKTTSELLQPEVNVFTKWEEGGVAVENAGRCFEKLLLMQTTDMNQSLGRWKKAHMLNKDPQRRGTNKQQLHVLVNIYEQCRPSFGNRVDKVF